MSDNIMSPPASAGGFAPLPELIAAHAARHGSKRALVDDEGVIDYSALDALMDRVAAGLERDGIAAGTAIAIVSTGSIASIALFLGSLRAGCVPALISPQGTAAQIQTMIEDSSAPLVFADDAVVIQVPNPEVVAMNGIDGWLPPVGSRPMPVDINPNDRFNIIYSSGTTGTPKGIVHTHALRWRQAQALGAAGFQHATTMVVTPLYSNTTMAGLLPTLAFGGTAVLLGKFDARRFLEVSERESATHVMLVPVQYQRIMAVPEFDQFNLAAYRFKLCTSAPFPVALKADVLRRWPGMLVEIYAMTEGGGSCVLYANMFPEKLHTVGKPVPGHDIRLIDEHGREVLPGAIGEVVGRSDQMMAGYHGRDDATDAAHWYDDQGNRFIRHGDLGRFDEDGFLTLMGRSKDMIISGGFNIYPPDIEAVLLAHPAISDAAVVGLASEVWGETPYAFVVTSAATVDPAEVVEWTNAQLSKTQRLSGLEVIAELPRNAMGKVMKQVLRDRNIVKEQVNAND